ncbi:MAG: hypothetical protein ACOZBL_05710 [Patescibacteria group bacterium]
MILASESAISSTILAASCTSIGVKSSHHVTAKIIFFAHSKLASKSGLSIALLAASTALFSHSQYHIQSNAVPEFCIITLISAKSILISQGFTIKSEIH